jgi:hypothetical protein
VLDGFTVTGSYANSNSSFSVNSVSINRRYGGGISLYSSASPVLSNLVVSGNTAYYGGGIYNSNSSPVITNVLVSDNIATYYGGGIYNSDGNSLPLMTNVTVAGNHANDSYGGIYFYNTSAQQMRNSIVYGNTEGADKNVSNVNNSNSAIYANTLAGGTTLNAGIISHADPLFADATVGDYRLQSFSPAIDMGVDSMYLSEGSLYGIHTDLAGNSRIEGCNVDLGAYETPNSIIVPDAAGRIYVRRGGAGNGSSWTDAYPDLARPLYLAQQCGVTEIWVADGVYCPEFALPSTDSQTDRDKTFYLVEGVKIYGGFTDTSDINPPLADPPAFGSAGRDGTSVLSGNIGDKNDDADNVYHVVVAAGDMGEALLDGFTVAGGYSEDITDNSSNIVTGNGRTFYRNHGAGIIVDGTMKFVNLTVSDNNAYRNGGGMYLNGNSSSGDNVIITNTMVFGNHALYGGGIYVNEGICYMTNLTVTGNTGSDSYGGLYHVGGTAYLRNSIVWGNRNNDGAASNVSGTFNHSHNLVEGGVVDGVNIVSNANPKFVDNNDYHLKAGSPAIDAGDNTFYDASEQPDLHNIITDLDGNPRFYGTAVDLGVFEVQDIPVVPVTAVNDTALTTVNTPVTVKVLANDDLGVCSDTPLDVFDTIVGYGPKHGIAAFTVDTLIYTPAAGHFGIDSLDYTFECSGNEASARVYILTVNPLSKPYYACPNAQVTVGFKAVDDVSYDWLAADMTTVIESSSNTITVTKDNSGNVQRYYARPSWKEMEFPLNTIELFPAADVTPAVSDIRVTLCPTPSRDVYLTGFLDSLSHASTVQWTTTGVFPKVYDASTGEIHATDFPNRGTFTYSYTRYSECETTSAPGKAYVHVPHGKIPTRPDTVVICLDQAATINVSAIFGLELGGVWNYGSPLNPDNLVADNTVTTAGGTIIFNGAKAFATTNTAYNIAYRGVAGKGFVFEYDYSGSACASGTKKMTIVVVDN